MNWTNFLIGLGFLGAILSLSSSIDKVNLFGVVVMFIIGAFFIVTGLLGQESRQSG